MRTGLLLFGWPNAAAEGEEAIAARGEHNVLASSFSSALSSLKDEPLSFAETNGLDIGDAGPLTLDILLVYHLGSKRRSQNNQPNEEVAITEKRPTRTR